MPHIPPAFRLNTSFGVVTVSIGVVIGKTVINSNSCPFPFLAILNGNGNGASMGIMVGTKSCIRTLKPSILNKKTYDPSIEMFHCGGDYAAQQRFLNSMVEVLDLLYKFGCSSGGHTGDIEK